MHRLVVFLAVCTWVPSIFAGGLNDVERCTERLRMCTTRNATENVDGCTGAFYTMYIYNENTSQCEELPESICDRSELYSVFFSYFDCSHTCTLGKAPAYCTATPYEPANGTCTDKERLWYEDENSTDPHRAWYYNASEQACVEYQTCRNPWKFPKNASGYSKEYFCEKACQRFTAEMMSGDGSGTVTCSGNPPALCDAEDSGRTRYFYNESLQACQEYRYCSNKWPKGLSAFNYFVTNRSCELECGNYDASKYEEIVSARDDLGDQYYADVY